MDNLIKKKYPPITVYQDTGSIDINYITTENVKNLFLNTTTIVYGPTNSMKTTTVRNIMYLLKNYFAFAIVYAPNNETNNDYTNIIPSPLIYNTINIEILRKIYEEQEARTKRRAEIDKQIKMLYDMVKTDENDNKFETIYDDKKKLSYMKSIIIQKKAYIDPKYNDLIKNINYNSKLLFILDDVSANLPTLLRSKDPIIKKMFFESRHINITFIWLIHNVSQLIPAFRDSAKISIFCKKNVAHRWFDNNVDRTTLKIAKRIIDAIFPQDCSDTNCIVSLYKLIYNKDTDKYYYIIPRQFKDFTMCSPIVYDALQRISKN